MAEAAALSPAQMASERALAKVRHAIERGRNFKIEAGAGAGKTYSLVKALQFLIERDGNRLRRLNQRIACITFTNVAKKEIEARTDRTPLIHCDTIHAFCWSIISGFQSQLRALVPTLDGWAGDPWAERLAEAGGAGKRTIEYALGVRGITDDTISIHHNDVLPLTIRLLGHEKFRNILRFNYPIILIDEYQDTDADWVDTIKTSYFGKDGPPLFGFFGDHWQKIYGNGCGTITDPAVEEIGVEANFRSVPAIVDCLNRMRPELQQFVVDPAASGEVHVFHTNAWIGKRSTGPHYGGDLPDQEAFAALAEVMERLSKAEWEFSPGATKILMLTHRALGKQQGYASLPTVFRDNYTFTKKEHPHIAFFVDHLEPACRAFAIKHYGEMFAALGTNERYILRAADKKRWAESFKQLIAIRDSGTVGDIVANLRKTQLPPLSEGAEKLERRFEQFDPKGDEEMPRALKELGGLHCVPYREIVAVADYLDGHSPFETKHGVKGAEFENVLVVLGRGWNRYDFGKMLENAPKKDQLNDKEKKVFEDNRNLFYVCCSRPKKRLALLFTQHLSASAMQTVDHWFGSKNISSLF